MRLHNYKILLSICLIVLFGFPNHAAAGVGNRYCGIDAVYASARWFGFDVSLDELTRPEFVSDAEGSSGSDLIAAAQAVDLKATPWQEKDLDTLSQNLPSILHVTAFESTPRPGPISADHWVLCAAYVDRRFIVIDGDTTQKVLPASLVRHWDGVALMLAPRDKAVSVKTAGGKWELAFVLMGVAFVLWAGLRLDPGSIGTHQMTGWGRFAIGSVVMMGVVGCATGTTAWASPLGTLAGWAPLAEDEVDAAAPRISPAELAALPVESVLLIDARDAYSFGRGTLPGAINVVPDIDTAGVGKLLETVAGRTVVVFCHSKTCSMADQLAAHFLYVAPGLRVRVMDEGYVGWKKWERSRS